MRDCVDVSLEGTIDDFCAVVGHVRHDRLVHASIPLNVSWLSVSVSVGGSVVLMVDGGLSCSPFSVSVRERRVLGENSCNVPVEEVWVVDKSLGVECIVIHNDGSRSHKTSAKSSSNEPHDPTIS